MPLLTKPASFTKGTPETVTLDSTILAAVPAITDSFYQDSANWDKIVFTYRNTEKQTKVVTFEASTPNTLVTLESGARSTYQVQYVTISDNAGGSWILKASELTDHDLELTILT